MTGGVDLAAAPAVNGVLPSWRRCLASRVQDAAIVASLAAVTAAPWVDQRLVPLTWLGLAVPLAAVGRLRGWRGETLVFAWAAASLAIAFHWAPAVIARSLNTSPTVGLLVTVPVILWDAIRWALPFWVAGRAFRDPLVAWLPAGLAAVVAEWLMPGVFPWKVGYSQIPWAMTVQAADLLGPEVTTLVAFAHAGVLVWTGRAVLAVMRPETARSVGSVAAFSWVGLAPLVVSAANLCYGAWAMRHWTAEAAAAPRLRAAVVQVDPTPDDSTPTLRARTREACASAREGVAASGAPFDLVVWPECSGGSYDFDLDCLSDEKRVWRLSRDPNRGLRPLESPVCPLLFGGKSFAGEPEKPRRLHQSAILIDCDERIVARYHKRHLMPFGEYVPGGDWLRDIKLWFPMEEEFDEGDDATVLTLPGKARLGVMLCYEDMVSSAAVSLVREGADMLVSLINGASFTDRLTLRQHRLLAQLRAIECRRSFVRCAATGETCLVSPVGVIERRLPVHVEDVLVVDAPLLESRTVYTTTGPIFPPLAAAALGALVALPRLRRRGGLQRSGNAAPAGSGLACLVILSLSLLAAGCSRGTREGTGASGEASSGSGAASSAPAVGSPAGGPGMAAGAGTGAGAAGGRPSGPPGAGAAGSPTGAAVGRLRQALLEANAALEAGDYRALAAKVATVRTELAQVDRVFAAGGVDATKAAAARKAVAALAGACGTIERALRSGAEVSDDQVNGFLGGVATQLGILERSAN